jgi:hypothetical protein
MKRCLPVATVLAITLGALALVSLASARQNVVTAKITVTGDNGDYIVTFENAATSTGNIRCWRWELGQGAMVTAASRADGWRLGLSKPAPAPIVFGQAVPPGEGIPPGGKVQFRILTDKPFDGNGSPGTAAVSEDCRVDAATELVFGSPPKPKAPDPEPKPKACVCKDLKTRILANRSSVTSSSAQGFRMELLVQWTLTCTKGAGACSGQITLVPSVRGKRLGIAVDAPAAAVTCKGPCANTTTRFQKYEVSGGARWATGKRGRADRLIRFQLKRTCKSTRLPQTFDVVFNRGGGIDPRLSDLNGNGIADGRD